MATTFDPDVSSTSRSPSPETPPSSSVALHPDNHDHWSGSALSNAKHNFDFESWTTLGDDLSKQDALLSPDTITNNAFDFDPASMASEFFAQHIHSPYDISSPTQDPSSPASQSQYISTSLLQNHALPSSTHPIPPPTMVSTIRRPRDNDSINPRIRSPPKSSCNNLPILFPNVPASGAKSRVETQIRVTLDLATSGDSDHYDRVGTWPWLRLPQGTSTRRRPRKDPRIEATPDDTLYLNSEITCASAPHLKVAACSSCQNREAKRIARKLAARVRPARSEEDEPSPVPPAITQADVGEDTGIIQFNCAEVLDFSEGTVTLPVRITCYCRHHREKVGFLVTFTLLDSNGRCVGSGTTPPIMITDDHKTTGKPNQSTDAEMESPQPHRSSNHLSERGSVPAPRPKRRVKPKPYDNPRTVPKPERFSPAPTTASPTYQSLPSPPMTVESNAPSPSPSTPDLLPQVTSILDESSMASFLQALEVPGSSMPTDYSIANPPLVSNSIFDAAAQFSLHSSVPSDNVPVVPKIHRLIPSSGPTHGGIEITVLGSDFNTFHNLNVMFGDCRSSVTQRWSNNTLVCLLPASATAGVVGVGFEGIKSEVDGSTTPSLFTYIDESDRALMELALQVVGLKMTGKIEDAKNVAMRIVGNNNGDAQNPTLDVSDIMQLSYRIGNTRDLEALTMKFLTLLDLKTTSGVSNANALAHLSPTHHNLLHLAVHLKFLSLVSFLISRGIDLDARDRNGFTPLHFASLGNWQEGVDILLEAGADTEIVDTQGRTAQECTPNDSDPLDFSASLSQQRAGRRLAVPSDDEGDADIEDEAEPALVTPPRISRRSSRTSIRASSGTSTPSQRSSSPVKVGLRAIGDNGDGGKHLTSDHETPPFGLDKKISEAMHDPAIAAQNFLNWIRGTFATLQAGNVPTVPWPLPQFNQIPQLPNIPKPHLPALPHLPDMQTLSQIPLVFPVYVAIPPWPTLHWPQPFSGDKRSESQVEKVEEVNKVLAASDPISAWKSAWEKWMAQVNLAIPQPPECADPPPMYSEVPSETSDRKVETKAEVQAVVEQGSSEYKLTSRKKTGSQRSAPKKGEVNAFGYHPVQKAKSDKKDRMLFWFWLPTLLLGFIWALFTFLPIAFNVLRGMLRNSL